MQVITGSCGCSRHLLEVIFGEPIEIVYLNVSQSYCTKLVKMMTRRVSTVSGAAAIGYLHPQHGSDEPEESEPNVFLRNVGEYLFRGEGREGTSTEDPELVDGTIVSLHAQSDIVELRSSEVLANPSLSQLVLDMAIQIVQDPSARSAIQESDAFVSMLQRMRNESDTAPPRVTPSLQQHPHPRVNLHPPRAQLSAEAPRPSRSIWPDASPLALEGAVGRQRSISRPHQRVTTQILPRFRRVGSCSEFRSGQIITEGSNLNRGNRGSFDPEITTPTPPTGERVCPNCCSGEGDEDTSPSIPRQPAAAPIPGNTAGTASASAAAASDARRALVGSLREPLQCVICCDLMAGAHALPCGHAFCGRCIRDWMELNNSCPTCREPATGAVPVRAVDLAVEALLRRRAHSDPNYSGPIGGPASTPSTGVAAAGSVVGQEQREWEERCGAWKRERANLSAGLVGGRPPPTWLGSRGRRRFVGVEEEQHVNDEDGYIVEEVDDDQGGEEGGDDDEEEERTMDMVLSVVSAVAAVLLAVLALRMRAP